MDSTRNMKGIYVLIIQLERPTSVSVGALGRLRFRRGLYAYVGSAQRGLEARIRRHLRKKKNRFWHIDYLLDSPAAQIAKVFIRNAGKTQECRIAEMLGKKGMPILGFGCSDCRCKSHLVRMNRHTLPAELVESFGFLEHGEKN